MAFLASDFRRQSLCATVFVAGLFAHEAAAQNATPDCRFEARGHSSTAMAVTDGRSFRLADGREIKLAGIDVPFVGNDPAGKAALASKAALERLVLGKEIRLTAASDATDRYGRIAAMAFVNGSESPVQYNLLALGQARVSAQALGEGCTRALYGQEARARESRLGLWADPGYAVHPAADGQALRPQQGRFSVAEGRVVSVRDSGGTIYLNFGSRWSEALTVIILKQNVRSFASAGTEPRTLEGRIVRIRGYVDVRNGPVIEASRPEQIEVAAR
jgi:endonuclease YncB( thermonuclease family)